MYPGYPFTGRWFRHASGLRQHYLDEGTGPPVLFLHGNPSWSYLWRRPIAALREEFRCVAPDHIGMGLSDKPGADRYEHTLASRVDDLDALIGHLIEVRGAPRSGWTLVLHDWGGPIGMAWACRHPRRVARLVVLNTAAFPNPRGERVRPLLRLPFRVLRDTRLGARLFLRHNAFARGATRRPLGVWRRMPAGVRSAFLAPYDRPEHRLAIQRFVQDIPLRPGDPSWPLLQATGASLAQFADRPMLIAWGLRDPVLDRAVLDEWRRRFPGARFLPLPRAGHYLLEDAHERLVPAIGSFLRSPAPEGAGG
ncbi:haloalkane dehalogenase [Sphaerisporangium melleum]|uniref:Haloalkane dehalogenase n=1 Tax=Sphaerisporangium melleum TaxID=321316 RepID=A0A917VSN5_9ACTN|nr:alpha/beta fold hydrolase [Sphaerisporangium melleum]GGL13853.1 haloalkane dehalogenase [Sphaerisporangium melleum]GII74623.1 haloalkane dehalogenase [Sphaerisporangium melleum]